MGHKTYNHSGFYKKEAGDERDRTGKKEQVVEIKTE